MLKVLNSVKAFILVLSHLLLDVGVSFGVFECGLADIFFTFVDNQICHTFWNIFNFGHVQVASIQQSSWNSTLSDFT